MIDHPTVTAPAAGLASGALLRALESMDVLNRWVRKTGCDRPRKAIYWLKGRFAIRDAIIAGLASRVRYVEATVKCNRCVNGVYYGWNGQSRGDCRHCGGQGLARLKFVETTLGDRFVWHTPLDYKSWHGWPMRDLKPEPVTDWQPGREGDDLPVEEAARHLNVVETYWPQWTEEKPSSSSFDEWDSTQYFNFNYSLALPGEEGPCALCGDPAAEEADNCRVTFPPGLTLTRRVCRVCKRLPDLWERLYAVPLPDLGPETRQWRERHLIQFAEAWRKLRWIFDREWQASRARPAPEPAPAVPDPDVVLF